MKVIIMQGIPGSGKSFTAKRLAGDDGIILSTDDFWQTTSGDYKFVPHKLREAHEWNQYRFSTCLMNKLPFVIVDNTNTTAKEWDFYRSRAIDYGYKVEFKRPKSPWWTDMEERVRNHTWTEADAQVLFEKNTHNVPLNVIKKMLNRFIFGE